MTLNDLNDKTFEHSKNGLMTHLPLSWMTNGNPAGTFGCNTTFGSFPGDLVSGN